MNDPSGISTWGNLPLLFKPVKAGIYTLVLRGWCGTQLCDSCTIRFKVDCPDTCNCKGGRWKGTTITPKGGKPKNVECNSVTTLKCKMPYTINSAYVCPQIRCNEFVKYKMTDPGGIVSSGNLALSFTPAKSGTYTLVLYGMCGADTCSKCSLKFKVKCP